ncbi:ABC-F family ATP-binding cassette domain-containing protein [Liberibacter crescens]|uniref:ABC-F family ATP-binding cassette domain-containing protein n=1 Tax=Liberibacter crescens TaxID=1273132 RepID=UPI00076323D3|nr:ABC-F family ATP-binding cassette domain-containing protein [Liberibacter crescens]AMC13352.1 elongation factor 3 [Liberibacter crescens]
MTLPLIKLDNINITIGGVPLLRDACLQVKSGERICLIGRNGSGKSTLLKIAVGVLETYSGEVFRHPSATIGYLEQNPDFSNFSTVDDYLNISSIHHNSDLHRITFLLDFFCLTGKEILTNLSVGQMRRVCLIKILSVHQDILILDEPTNHLDIYTIQWLEEELIRIGSALIFISHDRRFLEKVSTKTIWLHNSNLYSLDENFSYFEEWRNKIIEEKKIRTHNLKKKIESEKNWLRYGVTARRKRNVRRVKELNEMQQQLRNNKSSERKLQSDFQNTTTSGKLAIEVNDIIKTYGSYPVINNFSLRIYFGDRIGFVGQNGIGKTTLLQLITGQIPPDSGSVRLGLNVKIAIIDQKREILDQDTTVFSYLTGGLKDTLMINEQPRHVMGYLQDFLFQPDQAHTPIRNLSGGERMRLILARMMAQPYNVLIMDEPTNDLDMETMDFLQEIINQFTGTVLIASHDRDFLDQTVKSIITPAHPENLNGHWIKYAGGYSDMLIQKQKKTQLCQESLSKKLNKIPSTTQESKPSQKQTKLAYHQKFLLEKLPEDIEHIKQKILIYEKKLSNSSLFSEQQSKFNHFVAELELLYKDLEDKQEQWLELQILHEELTSSKDDSSHFK